jgi:hypothetical protein
MHKVDPDMEVGVVWNRIERALPEGDLEGETLEETAPTAG